MTLDLMMNRDSLDSGLLRLREEVDRTFDRFFDETFGYGMIEPRATRRLGWSPAVDARESDREITIRAEVPGVAPKDLEVSVSGRTLSISGQKEDVVEQSDENSYHCERRFGSFRRIIDLPDTVDTDKVTAELEHGLVTIHLMKKPGSKAKQIEVKPISKRMHVDHT